MQNFCENEINVEMNFEFRFTTFQIKLSFFQEPNKVLHGEQIFHVSTCLSDLRMYMYMCEG